MSHMYFHSLEARYHPNDTEVREISEIRLPPRILHCLYGSSTEETPCGVSYLPTERCIKGGFSYALLLVGD